ncbi:MAG: glutamate formiminotransferase, partial [Gemmatimonadota bacterium]|nr:glutamate formiminotransferase [Gemmatimonadota bacterium]
AETVRTSSGGLPGVHAKGFAVEGRAQVSMNLLDVTATTLQDVFDKVGIEAKKLNTDVYESELVGLAPQAVLDSKIADEIKLRTDWTDHVLELKLDEARERAG